MSDSTSGAVPTSWFWQFPGGTPATSTVQNPTVTYTIPGVYDVTLTVSDGLSQTTMNKPAYISVVGPTPTPSVITGPTAICANTTNTYSVAVVPDVTYNWTIPATWTGMSTSSIIDITSDITSGTISVTAENVCGNSAPSTLAITVNPGAPAAAFTNSVAGGNVNFTSTSTNTTSWSWSFGDGVGTSTSENPSYSYLTNGTYTVTLIASNGCGSDTITQSVTITGVGLSENAPEWIRVYPVPADNSVFVALSQVMDNAEFAIYDVTGKVIRRGTLTGNTTEISIDALASGMYELRIANQYTYRIVKK
jgi:PKD repeat protein